MAKRGFGQTYEQIVEVVKRMLDLAGRTEPLFNENRPGKSWFYGFMARNDDLKRLNTEKLEISRAMSCRPERVNNWFTELKAIMDRVGICVPSQIYNCDESGFPLQTKGSGKVIVMNCNSCLLANQNNEI